MRNERIASKALHEFIVKALESTGVPAEGAGITAGSLVTTDAMGVFTHGSKLLAGYLKKLRGGGYSAIATPEILRQGPGWAVIDGHSCLGQIGCDFATKVAIEKARATGVAYVGLIETGHIGAAGQFAALAARQGFIAMITGNDIPSVAAPGSRKAVLGSNPIALAIPVSGRDPILLDIATAAVAGGKVYAAIQRGEAIPPTWLIGPDGHPTCDGTLYPDDVSLAPMAGHKGYGFGLWCEVLSAILPGGRSTWEVGSWIFDPPDRPSWHNASLTLYDVGMIAPRNEFDARIARLIDEIHQAPVAEGIENVLLPGEREWANLHESSRLGIALPPDVIAKLKEASDLTGVPAP